LLYTWLRSFHAVAREGGFTAAATALNVSQSTVSVQVKTLEERFNAELFLRQGHQVILTDVGKELFEITRNMIGNENEAAHLLENVKSLTKGHLRIGTIAPAAVMELFEEYNRCYPGIDVSISFNHGEKVLRDLLELDFDVVVLAKDPGLKNVHCIPYGQAELLVIVNADHRLANRKRLRIEELQGERMLIREAASTTREALENAANEAGFAFESTMEISSREAIIQGVLRGIGISLISEGEFFPHKNLRALRVSNADLHINFFVACLAARSERPLIASFFERAQALSEANLGPVKGDAQGVKSS